MSWPDPAKVNLPRASQKDRSQRALWRAASFIQPQVLRRHRPEHLLHRRPALGHLEQGRLTELDHALLNGLLADGVHRLPGQDQPADRGTDRQHLENPGALDIAGPVTLLATARPVQLLALPRLQPAL